ASSDRTPLHPTARAPSPAVSPPMAIARRIPGFLFAMWRGSAAGRLGAGRSLAGVARPGKAWLVPHPLGSPRGQYSIQMFSMQGRADTRSARSASVLASERAQERQGKLRLGRVQLSSRTLELYRVPIAAGPVTSLADPLEKNRRIDEGLSDVQLL